MFDWTGVSPSGQFGQIVSNLPTRYGWDTSALYTLGQVALVLSATSSPINGQWATNGSGTWSGTANWTGGNVPGAPQDTAVFGTVLTSGTATVTLDVSLSLASLGFSTTGGASYVISPSVREHVDLVEHGRLGDDQQQRRQPHHRRAGRAREQPERQRRRRQQP